MTARKQLEEIAAKCDPSNAAQKLLAEALAVIAPLVPDYDGNDDDDGDEQN